MSQVMKLSPENENVFVAYLYWDSRFDEWVNNVEERLAPLHTHTYTDGGVLKVGQRIEVLDDTQKWLEAFVIEEREGPAWVRPEEKEESVWFRPLVVTMIVT